MPQGIAKKTEVCRVCGATIRSGINSTRWVEGVAGSVRHAECFGKKDKYDPMGKPLPGVGAPGQPQTGTLQALEQMAAAKKGTKAPSTGLDDVSSGNGGSNPIPIEMPESSAVGNDNGVSFEDDGKAPWDDPKADEDPGPDVEPSAAPAGDLASSLAKALEPVINQKFKKHELAINNQVKQHLQKQNIPSPAALKQDAKQAAVEAVGQALATVESMVESKVAKAIENKGNITIVVKNENGDVLSKLEGLNHRDMPKLLKLMTLRKNIYLPGPTGSGKSTAAKIAAGAIKTKDHPNGLPFYYVSLNPQASPTRIEGYQTPGGEYIITLFRKAYEFGGVFCADEADNASPNLWVSLNNAIDSELGSFPDGMVKRHPDFIFVGTGNTNLSGDLVYRDRKAADKSTISRFVFLEWDYDLALEKAVTLSKNPKALPWLNWVARVREWSKTHNPAMYPYATPRASYDGAELLGAGFPVTEVANMVLFKRTFDQTAMSACMQAVPLPTQSMKA